MCEEDYYDALWKYIRRDNMITLITLVWISFYLLPMKLSGIVDLSEYADQPGQGWALFNVRTLC